MRNVHKTSAVHILLIDGLPMRRFTKKLTNFAKNLRYAKPDRFNANIQRIYSASGNYRHAGCNSQNMREKKRKEGEETGKEGIPL